MTDLDGLKAKIRHVADFPKAGILFYDITTLLQDPAGLHAAIDALAMPFKDQDIELVVGPESRGFIFGAAVADRIGAGFSPIRKPGKLPSRTVKATYDLEYGTDVLEMHEDGVGKGRRVLIVDDLLATGGTATAACDLVKRCGGQVAALAFLIELVALNGRRKLAGERVYTVLQVLKPEPKPKPQPRAQMFTLLSSAIVAAAVVWAAVLIAREIRLLRAETARARSLDLVALFAPGMAASAADPRALLTWQPLATAARQVFPESFQLLDQASGGRFPFSVAQIQAAHSQWTADWLAWEHAHDGEFKLKSATAQAELAASGGEPLARARLDGVEREKLERYQRRYAEYVHVAKGLQALLQKEPEPGSH